MIVIGESEVRRRLDHATCIGLMRDAMIALSRGRTRQLLRGIVDLGGGDQFGVMPGAIDGESFGCKLVTVFSRNSAAGLRSHRGVILVFEPEQGLPIAVIEAGEVTAIRTAAASAAATDVLARPDARRLAILGTGEQAWHHALALSHVRPIEQIQLWGRSPDRAGALAKRIGQSLNVPVSVAGSAGEAARGADIICTVSAASEPILMNTDVDDGTHINAVGSSRAGPSEIDVALVARSRIFPDHRAGILAQGAEYLRAAAVGLVSEEHVLSEIGAVIAGDAPGRTAPEQVTLYKSLGHIVQDLASAHHLVGCAVADGRGDTVSLS